MKTKMRQYVQTPVIKFLKSEKVSVLSHPPYSTEFASCEYIYKMSGRRHRFRSALESAAHQFLMSVPKSE